VVEVRLPPNVLLPEMTDLLDDEFTLEAVDAEDMDRPPPKEPEDTLLPPKVPLDAVA